MTAVLDAIKAHSQPDLRRRLEVSEWSLDGEKPLVITYQMMTMADVDVVHEAAKGAELSKTAPYIVAFKACDEAGQRMFKMGDALVLRETAAPDVLTRIAVQMLGRVNVEEAEKN